MQMDFAIDFRFIVRFNQNLKDLSEAYSLDYPL